MTQAVEQNKEEITFEDGYFKCEKLKATLLISACKTNQKNANSKKKSELNCHVYHQCKDCTMHETFHTDYIPVDVYHAEIEAHIVATPVKRRVTPIQYWRGE